MGIPSFCLYCILLIVLIAEGNRMGFSASKNNVWPVHQYFNNQLKPQHYVHGEIVRGKDVKSIEQHPYMAFLFSEIKTKLDENTTNTESSICGATILTTKHLLTAAHCLENCFIVDAEKLKRGDYVQTICKKYNFKYYTVFVGSTVPRHALEKRKVRGWFIHPDYDIYDKEKKCNSNNDIAIVELKTALTFTKEISFVTLPPPGFKDTVHMKCQVIGWGQTEDRWVFGLDVHLKFANVNYINNRKCINHYKYVNKNLTDEDRKNVRFFYTDEGFCKDTQLCTLNKKKGICEGDSGGPLMCNGVQVGVTSLIHNQNNNETCVGPHKPRVYTRVDKYLKWINSIIYWATPTRFYK